MTKPGVYVRSLTFSDSTRIELKPNDIVVIVGPNNVGKSAALEEIEKKVAATKNPTKVVTDLSFEVVGDEEALITWLKSSCRELAVRNAPDNPSYSRLGSTVRESQALSSWRDPNANGLSELGKMFVYRLTTDSRLEASRPASNIQITTQALTHPIHYMQVDDSTEERISFLFRQAFGQDLIVHRNAGIEVPLHVGQRPVPANGDDRVSLSYIRTLERLPTLGSQGDGMRAFVGVLLHAFVVDHSSVLVDEPEVFLHPPQARLLGKSLLSNAPADRQLFVATHSGDLLRGLLDANDERLRIIRIERQDDVNPVAELDNDGVRELWKDPLLRYSNVLDGVFHARVVVCEGDADCRFYAAVKDALEETNQIRDLGDTMFVNAGGVQRIPLVVRSLRNLNVPVVAICDFDVLNNKATIQGLVQDLGGDLSRIESDLEAVRRAIESKKPDLETKAIKREVTALLKGVTEDRLPNDVGDSIRKALRRTSPWSIAKTVGKSFVPSGPQTKSCARLLDSLAALGLHVVEVGELESWCRSVDTHGPSWVNKVLTEKDLTTDPELEPARKFIAQVLRKD